MPDPINIKLNGIPRIMSQQLKALVLKPMGNISLVTGLKTVETNHTGVFRLEQSVNQM